jgi:ribosomal protein S1
MPYGAFARITDAVEGFIHVSTLAAERLADPSEAVSVGDVRPVRIVAIDRERRRLRCLLASLTHIERRSQDGHRVDRTYNRNTMKPAPIYGQEEF